MFEGYTRYMKLIGRGVAACCPDGSIRKFKIIGVKVQYLDSGEKIEGIELEMPSFLANQFEAVGRMKKEGCHYWINTAELYRNKGECARAHADFEIERVKRKIKNAEEELSRICKDNENVARRLAGLEKNLGDLIGSYGKEKWFYVKSRQGGN